MNRKKEAEGFKKVLIIFALLLLCVNCVSSVNANEQPGVLSEKDEQTIFAQFDPIDKEIRTYNENIQNIVISDIKDEKNNDLGNTYTELSIYLVEKYSENLNQIVETIERGTGIVLSIEEKTELKTIIIQEHIAKIAWEQKIEKTGVKEEDFTKVFISTDVQSANEQLLSGYTPDSLTLVQVYVDVYGGTGLDTGLRPYEVYGGNEWYMVEWYTYQDGHTLYQIHFRDEDVATSHALDVAYDEYRLAVYGTIEDVQGFYIYPSGYIEFGNDWDNYCTYATTVGQHGYAYLPYNSSTKIYVSNVWNHAMGIIDRNSSMGKITSYL